MLFTLLFWRFLAVFLIVATTNEGQAGATAGVYVYIYIETHRSGKLSVNHKGN